MANDFPSGSRWEVRVDILGAGERHMARIIDLEGLPEPVATAITETVLNLKNRYKAHDDKRLGVDNGKALRDLPSRPGRVIGSLRRVDLYEDR
jgi:hypothetical protein